MAQRVQLTSRREVPLLQAGVCPTQRGQVHATAGPLGVGRENETAGEGNIPVSAELSAPILAGL